MHARICMHPTVDRRSLCEVVADTICNLGSTSRNCASAGVADSTRAMASAEAAVDMVWV
jgi:hypothetical protein